MNTYESSEEDFDDFAWEDKLLFTSQQLEKFTDNRPDSRKLRARRKIEDIQERREQKKRMRLAMDEWDMVY